jgi:hypothetical protein
MGWLTKLPDMKTVKRKFTFEPNSIRLLFCNLTDKDKRLLNKAEMTQQAAAKNKGTNLARNLLFKFF